MCNRYKSKLQALQIRALLSVDPIVMQEAETWRPKADVRITDEAPLIFQHGNRWVIGTGFWGVKIGGKQRFNARDDMISTKWSAWDPCWLVATSWVEYPEGAGATEVYLPDGSPFLLAGLHRVIGDSRRFEMVTQDSPANLVELGSRMPIPFALEAVGQAAPVQISERMVFEAEWRSPR